MASHLANQLLQISQILDRQSRQELETMQIENPAKISAKKSKTKKIDRVETSLKEFSRDTSLFKFKSGTVVALVLFVVFGL